MSSKRLVAQGRYNEALAVLEAEIPVAQIKAKVQSSTDLMDLLSQRSFVLLKLRRYNAAKNDANELIRLDPHNTRGYTLKSKVYSENKHYKLAIQALKACLKALPRDSTERPSIKDKILAIEARSKFRFADPVRLPYELTLKIFLQVVRTARHASILTLVSKDWHQHVSREPRYWTNLRFSRSIAGPTVLRAAQRSGGQPLSLEIGATIGSPRNFLVGLASLENLSALSLSPQFVVREMREAKLRLQRLEYLRATTDAINLDLVWLLENCGALRRICITEQPSNRNQADSAKLSCPLQALEISGCQRSRLNPVLLSSVLEQCSLQLLTLDHACSLEVAVPVLQQPTLRSFSFQCPTMSSVLNEVRSPLESLVLKYVRLEQAPNLQYARTLDIQNCDFGDFSVSQFCQAATLETLVLNANKVTVQNDPSAWVVMPRLERLEFTSMPILINLRFIEWVEQTMPNLKHINLNESPVEGRYISRLLAHGLTTIQCRGSYNISAGLMQQIQALRDAKVLFK